MEISAIFPAHDEDQSIRHTIERAVRSFDLADLAGFLPLTKDADIVVIV